MKCEPGSIGRVKNGPVPSKKRLFIKKESIMKKVLVAGSKGFVGRNLCAVLRQSGDVELYEYDVNNRPEDLDSALGKVDCIVQRK